jgi:hypothetical protein
MNHPLYLFCGGPAIYGEGLPKPLMKIQKGRSLLAHYLIYLKQYRQNLPESVTLLCDDEQEAAIKADITDFSYPVPIQTLACGVQPNTFEKLCRVLLKSEDSKRQVQFGYPDIFSLEEFAEPQPEAITSDALVHISAAALTSRFPRLIVDVYNNKVRGISNYTSPVPANPLHVFGGDLWGRVDHLLELVKEFQDQATTATPSLEYDFFFWLINHNKMNCVLLHGERLWVDSIRDVNQLLARTGNVS